MVLQGGHLYAAAIDMGKYERVWEGLGGGLCPPTAG